MTSLLTNSVLRPLLIASIIGALFLLAIVWLSVTASQAQIDASNWTEHTTNVLRALQELDVELGTDTDLRPLLSEVQALTADNDSQQRRLAPLLLAPTNKKQIALTSLVMRGEEIRLLAERQARRRNDARTATWLLFTLAGFIGVLVVTTVTLISYSARRRERKVELLAMNIDTAFSASPESSAYPEIKELMEEIRKQVGGIKRS